MKLPRSVTTRPYHLQITRAIERQGKMGERTRWDLSLCDSTHQQTRVLADPALHATAMFTGPGGPLHNLVVLKRALILNV